MVMITAMFMLMFVLRVMYYVLGAEQGLDAPSITMRPNTIRKDRQ